MVNLTLERQILAVPVAFGVLSKFQHFGMSPEYLNLGYASEAPLLLPLELITFIG